MTTAFVLGGGGLLGAHDQVGLDAGLGKSTEHADLVRAQQASAAEDECRGHERSLATRSAPKRPQP